MVKIIECPRDAMQGMHEFIPTETKVEYLNTLLKVGFDTLDCGSFVSAKAIPQLKDTAEVLSKIDTSNTKTKLLAIIANLRGAEDALHFPVIDYLGFPFSISETFQVRNTNSKIEESLDTVKKIQELCVSKNRELVIYISMAFGNPYGDEWNEEIVGRWVQEMVNIGIKTIALADTVGVADPSKIKILYSSLIPAFTNVEFGAHFHSRSESWREKIDAAYSEGCRRFDSAMKGFGGCPMAGDDLVGNVATENLLAVFSGEVSTINSVALVNALTMASEIFKN